MNTNEVCKIINISTKSLRLYEEYEIVVPKRKSNNYRDYTENDLLKLRTVKLLKELGFSLKDIKVLIDNNNYESIQFIRSLYLQSKAIDRKIYELQNIKNTLTKSLDKILLSNEEIQYYCGIDDIDIILKENKNNRRQWVDMWGFDNKAVKFDKMVRDKTNDELGLFSMYDDILADIRNRIIEYNAKKVIDIGCGTGNLCGELSDSIDVLGIDQSLEMILQAKNKYRNMNLRLGNFLDEPVIKNNADIVVTTYAFHSLNHEEKKIAINNMIKYLNDNGKIIIVDFMFNNEEERATCRENLLSKGKYDLWEVINNKYYTNIAELKNYIIGLDFKIKIQHIINFTWVLEIEK